MIRAIIFDLDNCLSSSDAMGRDFLDPVFAAIRAANGGEVSEEQVAGAFRDMWRTPFDAVAKKHGFTDAMRQAGWDASCELEVRGPMRGYDDLEVLRELPVKRYLVTSGFRRMQESKIDALGIRDAFEGAYVDAIDEPARKGKEKLFAEIASAGGFQPGEVLVVGDHPDSEIAAGNRLGMHTAQILRPGVERGDTAEFVIGSLRELPGLLVKLAGGAVEVSERA